MTPDKSFNPKIENKPINMVEVEKEVSIKIEQYKKLPIIIKAFELLDKLPEKLTYHNKAHTEDVLHEAILFGVLDGLNEKELERLAVAASWHDVGFIDRPNENEEIAIRYFKEANKDYPLEYADEIEEMILDTTVRTIDGKLKIIMSQSISAHLLDADLSNFGRPDFKQKARQVAAERGVKWEDKTERLKFLESTLTFIKNHEWHTEAGKNYRQEQKEKNIIEMEKEIAELK